MKNITKNYTLYTFEELSEKAQEEAMRSFSNDSYDFAMLGVNEKFIEIFDEYFYGESYQKCEMTKFYTGGGMITGTLNPYDVLEVVTQRYPDEELRKEMEMILTENHHLDIEVKSAGAYVYGESYIDQILYYNAETDEEKVVLNERLNNAIVRLEEIILQDFTAMSEKLLLEEEGLIDFYTDDDYIVSEIEGSLFLEDGTLFAA